MSNSIKHQKHAAITKPEGGSFNRNELAILGAPCGTIQHLAQQIAEQLKHLRIGYVDADHGENTTENLFHTRYTDKISFHQLDFSSSDINYDFRGMFSSTHLALINGNHFKAKQQIVIINEKKRDSLQRKLDRLTDVQFFILDQGQNEIFEFLVEANTSFAKLPRFAIDDVAGISKAISGIVDKNLPSIKGLVLAGGQSQRMGSDKSEIRYHGVPQKSYTAGLLKKLNLDTYYSLRQGNSDSDYPVIEDSFNGLGPYGGILSAFRKDPNAAWLTVATDIPLLDEATLAYLVENRDPSKVATCFHNPETNFPEPLITLWEPRAYPRLLMFLSQGYSCPRKALINSDVKELDLKDPGIIANANTPDEKEKLMAKIHG